MHVLADAEQTVLVTTGNIQQFELPDSLVRILDEFFRLLGIGRGRESTHPGESIKIVQTEIQRLTSSHRQPCQSSRFAVRLHRIRLFNERNQIFDQIHFKRCKRR